jgi:hypothetical protein
MWLRVSDASESLFMTHTVGNLKPFATSKIPYGSYTDALSA